MQQYHDIKNIIYTRPNIIAQLRTEFVDAFPVNDLKSLRKLNFKITKKLLVKWKRFLNVANFMVATYQEHFIRIMEFVSK